MQLEFPSQPKTSCGAARSGPIQHDSTSQHLAGAEFAQPTRLQTPQMQAHLYNETFIHHLSKNENTPHINQSIQFTERESNKEFTILTARDQNRRDLTPSTTVPHHKGVMVWMGISANGVTKPRFVTPGAKINSDYYIEKILKPFLKDDYSRLYPNSDAVLHQDSVQSHASRITQKFLTDQQMQFLRPQQ
ncbi:hypothetical protein AVEN_226980-1 [Araneus ventricosus]|uniref:Tc1-like transposase DDE domain-containing protein n=1 Tax=Araneus ventricosus TaxID=182803 RepID=A0A4Y2QLC4_ARAVE|nr:hypothetical protein AVEN_226980-1 [Araneus ventricosus]